MLWSAFVMAMMFMPAKGLERITFTSLDKLVHISVFAMLSYLAITGLVKQYRFSIRKLSAAKYGAIYAAGFGLITEFGQYILGYRSFDFFDILANFTGAGLGFIYFQFWISKCLRTPYNLSS